MRDTTRRGFTFHEHLGSTGLAHMNGRAYDPVIGRFVSADPFVPAPLYSQSLSRYSYVFNNPLAESDPSGYGPDWSFWDIDWPRWLDWDTLFAGNDRDVEVHCNNDSHFCARADYVAAMFMECGFNK